MAAHELETTCPVCDSILIVCCEAEAPAPEIGREDWAFSGFILEQNCQCWITGRELDKMAEDFFEDMAEAAAESRLP